MSQTLGYAERGLKRSSLRDRLEVLDSLGEDGVKVIESVLDGIPLKHTPNLN